VLTYPPIDKAKLYHPFIHNPGAFDPDGDSLSYKLTMCLGDNGVVIPGYTYPYANNTLFVDPITGDLIWDSPQQTGIYNVAMLIEEWRLNENTHSYIKISEILRDIQIEVIESDNREPVIYPLRDLCVVAGEHIHFPVVVTDPDNDGITLNAYGGPFQVPDSPAQFDTLYGHGIIASDFDWYTNCTHVKKFPYLVVFRAKDDDPEINLVTQAKVYMTVVSPAPDSLTATPTTNSVFLNWKACICNQALRYDIYRRQNPSGWNHDTCETGVPSYTGFQLIGAVNGSASVSYLDNNNGAGLPLGYNYCYRIDAVFADGAESYASNEVCTELVKGIPVMTHVSVNKTDNVLGKNYIEWSKPNEFDTIVAPGPYKYLIYHSYDYWGQTLQLIDSTNSINDTMYIDTLLNTVQTPVSYKVEFYNSSPRFLIGTPNVASSVYLTPFPDDNKVSLHFDKNVPWMNYRYDVFRKNSLTLLYDSIGTTSLTVYVDSNLVNGVEYCYKVKSFGEYTTGDYDMPFINWSQEVCSVPLDTTPPCNPLLSVVSHCDSISPFNHLVWRNPNHYCCNDVTSYNIYYSPTLSGTMVLIHTIGNPNDTVYDHYPTGTMAGCYIVTAVDSFMNESSLNAKICIDNCNYYVLPNIFTPDDNNQNELFIPGPHSFVDKVDMKIYNRWGKLIFQTEDPDIKWDGRDMDSKKMVPLGVYYYICDVYEPRLTGIEKRSITGFVHVATLNNKGVE
jgi:gliding motility-associated-like protein